MYVCVCVYVCTGLPSEFPAATIKNRRESQFSDAIEKERFAGFYTAVVRRSMSRVLTIHVLLVLATRTRRQYLGTYHHYHHTHTHTHTHTHIWAYTEYIIHTGV
jgi:hypothetical protein